MKEIAPIARRSPVASRGLVDLLYEEQCALPRLTPAQLQRQRAYSHFALDGIDRLRSLTLPAVEQWLQGTRTLTEQEETFKVTSAPIRINRPSR